MHALGSPLEIPLESFTDSLGTFSEFWKNPYKSLGWLAGWWLDGWAISWMVGIGWLMAFGWLVAIGWLMAFGWLMAIGWLVAIGWLDEPTTKEN